MTILIDNTDDHEKNQLLLMNDRAQQELSPAFDVLPSGQAAVTPVRPVTTPPLSFRWCPRGSDALI